MTLPPGPPIPNSVAELIRVYQRAQLLLMNQIILLSNKGSLGTARYKSAVLARVNATLKKLKAQTDDWIDTNVIRFYKEGIAEADKAILEQYIAAGQLPPDFPAAFTVIDQAAVNILVNDVKLKFSELLLRTQTGIDNDLRQAILGSLLDKVTTGQTLKQVQANMLKILEERGIRSFTYMRNGRPVSMSLSAYVEVLSRSMMAEITNLASIQRAEQVSGDLVKMTEHMTSCPICWPYQGRVYSISGNDPRYPPLDIPFGGDHANIHPNCRHRIKPYIPALKSSKELARDLAISNRPFEIENMPQSQQKIFKRNLNTYNQGQVEKRKLLSDRKQHQRYLARLGENAPQTFSGFRRIKNADSDRWAELQSQYRKAGRKEKVST